jgi:hypothetical protein
MSRASSDDILDLFSGKKPSNNRKSNDAKLDTGKSDYSAPIDLVSQVLTSSILSFYSF